MPKKREVASLVGNFSPVERRRAILVRRIRHLRGETGDVLKTRAGEETYCGQPAHWIEVKVVGRRETPLPS
jgi:hypothetical protein